MTSSTVSKRHPVVPDSRVLLSEQLGQSQIKRGQFTLYHGEPIPIPVDDITDRGDKTLSFLGRPFWTTNEHNQVSRIGTKFSPPKPSTPLAGFINLANQKSEGKVAEFLNRELRGHDAHFSISGNLYARQFHSGWANPYSPDDFDVCLDSTFQTAFRTHWPSLYRAQIEAYIARCREDIQLDVIWGNDPSPKHINKLTKLKRELAGAIHLEQAHSSCRLGPSCPARLYSWDSYLEISQSQVGFIEDQGWLSGALVTDAFVSEIVDELVSATSSEFADFDYHEVGTSSTAESNDHTALQATSGIARATGSPTDSDPDYVNVATITADASETWEEHGIFNNVTSVAMMDRNLTGGQAVTSSDQVEYTYTLTVNPET